MIQMNFGGSNWLNKLTPEAQNGSTNKLSKIKMYQTKIKNYLVQIILKILDEYLKMTLKQQKKFNKLNLLNQQV